MKRSIVYGLAIALLASCSTKELDTQKPFQDDVTFFASFEQPDEAGTRVFANEEFLLRWNADDRVSIFNKNTYNQQYKFTGDTGDNAGGFDKVEGAEFTTGNAIPHVVSVYPYRESTEISESETITVSLPAEQHYAENTFGLGANPMVSVTSDNFLLFKNVGGYLRLSLYGDGVSVSSITLKGNNGEKLAGKATVVMPQDGTPTVTLAQDAAEEMTLVCDTPVALGATVEESVDFWFVVPPVTFSKGFTVTVSYTGGVFEKVTYKSITIERNTLSKMTSAEVEFSQPRNVIYYTSTDGSVVTPYNPNAFGANIISNDYHDGIGIIAFDGDVTLIGEMAFTNRTTLSSIILPNSVTSIERMAFYECLNLETISLSYGVTKIGGYAFRRCTKLSSITIPDSVVEIGGSVFAECTSLSDVSLSDNLECISIDLFHDCPSLDNIIIPETVTTIQNSAFWNCSSLSNITIPDGVTSIGYGVFRGCNSLNSFKGKYSSTDGLLLINSGEIIAIAPGTVDDTIPIPSEVTSIGVNSFAGCDRISSIVIPQGVTTIKTGAFSYCKNLTCVTIRDGLISIGSGSFESCEHLTSVVIPETVVSMGDYAFADCSNLDGIIIPSSTTSIGRFAFRGCKSLSSIIIPNGIKYLEQNMFENCAELDSVILPDNLIGIGYSSFSGCSGLPSIVIPETVKGISSFAFAGCSSLLSVVLPSGVSIVDEWAYYGCNSLNSITVLSEIPPSGGSNMFGDTNDCPIYVPAGSVEAYKSAEYWSDYADRIRAIPSSVPVPEAVDLGLSVKWASFNLGASKPEEYGDFYAWGETEPKDVYNCLTYKWCIDSYLNLTKYCPSDMVNYWGGSGSPDGKTAFSDYDYEDDAARTYLHHNWRTPTDAEWAELLNNCLWIRTDNYMGSGVDGYEVVSKSDGSQRIFLPFTGMKSESQLNGTDMGYYWSSSLYVEAPSAAWCIDFQRIGGARRYYLDRHFGLPIRPVLD